MFSFYNWKKNVFIGLDIGTSSIKMVELEVREGKPILSNYAWMPLDDNPADRNDINSTYFDSVFPEYIKRMIKEAKFKTKDAYASIPSFGGLITLIDFPEMASEDMEQAIKFEAHKYIPTSLDEVVLSWDVVGKINKSVQADNNAPVLPNSNNRTQVLLVAASKNKVFRYEKLIKKSGLNLVGLELENFSIINSLIGNDQGTFFIVDIGSRVCNIVLVEKGIIRANRNIDAGGRDLTRAIAKGMGVNEERAEKLKTSGKNFFSNDSYINFPTLELIVGEISRMINSYAKNRENAKIDSIILSGGTSNLVGITEYFANALNTKTLTGNPFSRITYDSGLEPIISKMKTNFSVSVGLALKGVNNYLIK